MRLRNFRLIAPKMALRAKITENCQARGESPRQKAASIKVAKLPPLTKAASRERKRPRASAGISDVIHGSHAQLEIPRDKLNPKRQSNMSESRAAGVRNPDVKGTSAIRKINATRIPQPAKTKV